MSPTARETTEWEITPVASKSVNRGPDERIALTLQITRNGKPVATAPLRLTVAEAERVHAALCHALDQEPVPSDAPECRKSIQYPGGRQRY
ncbi:hypothetical protein ACF082_15630 [Streptomyces lydicus]|uniref:hypothetical protein n=1 Tax=Streptomyces lydicus TaxID=47763 RepID=UPI002E3693A5|nr:hypothetical protein [Streptomyces lydicus]